MTVRAARYGGWSVGSTRPLACSTRVLIVVVRDALRLAAGFAGHGRGSWVGRGVVDGTVVSFAPDMPWLGRGIGIASAAAAASPAPLSAVVGRVPVEYVYAWSYATSGRDS